MSAGFLENKCSTIGLFQCAQMLIAPYYFWYIIEEQTNFKVYSKLWWFTSWQLYIATGVISLYRTLKNGMKKIMEILLVMTLIGKGYAHSAALQQMKGLIVISFEREITICQNKVRNEDSMNCGRLI